MALTRRGARGRSPAGRRPVVHALDGDCRRTEVLTAAAGVESFPATDVAADAGTLYLLLPGTGIVAHDFRPSGPAC